MLTSMYCIPFVSFPRLLRWLDVLSGRRGWLGSRRGWAWRFLRQARLRLGFGVPSLALFLSPPFPPRNVLVRWTGCVTGWPAVPGGLQGRGAACWLARLSRPFPPSLPVTVCGTWWPAAVGTSGLRGAACWRALLGW